MPPHKQRATLHRVALVYLQMICLSNCDVFSKNTIDAFLRDRASRGDQIRAPALCCSQTHSCFCRNETILLILPVSLTLINRIIVSIKSSLLLPFKTNSAAKSSNSSFPFASSFLYGPLFLYSNRIWRKPTF